MPDRPDQNISPDKIFSGVHLDMAKAIERDKAGKLQSLLNQHGEVDLDKRGAGDMTLLYWAVGQRAEQSVRFLLSQGADPNKPVSIDRGPVESILAIAVGTPKEGIFRALLEAGADPNGKMRGSQAIVQAVRLKEFDRMVALLEAGADVNTINGQSGASLVQVAADLFLYDYVLYLLKRGADPAFVDPSGTDLAWQVSKDAGTLTAEVEGQRMAVQRFLEGKGYEFPAKRPKDR